MTKKALVAMSGGVDSAVAALLIKEAGFDTAGMTMKLWSDSERVTDVYSGISTPDIEDAKRIADTLGIPHHVLSLGDTFRECVIDNFIKEYKNGATPNPCVECNKRIKFGKMLDVALDMERCGFRRLHVVDLDGAKSRHIVNDAALRSITSSTKLKVDFGGGIKTNEDIARAFDAGAAMVTVGSVAVTCPELFMGWLDTYGADRLILGADVRNGMISINGWKEDSAEELLPFLKQYVDKGVRNVLCTDISKDGTLQGPATGLYRQIMDAYPTLHLIASGGVGSNEDIKALADSGIPAVVFGKAYYEGKINIDTLWEH